MLGLVIREIAYSFVQFFTWKYPVKSFLRTLGIIHSAILRVFLGRSVKYSYAYTGEDRIIESLLNKVITYNGFFVEVGANHPVFISNTYSLYRKGWRGVCIDANEKLIGKYGLYRPRDIAVCALVSDQEILRDFYLVENDVLSTLEINNLDYPRQNNLAIKSIEIKSRTLTSILDEWNAPQKFDLLSIDAEEHDFNVLLSLDFSKYRPGLIVLEDETFTMVNSENNKICRFLFSKRYKLEGFILKNLYFKSEDQINGN